MTIVTGATLLALAGHLVEMGLWAVAFDLCGEFSDFAAALYHSAGNYTTLGDSSVVISARWRLLGPLEAANGMLMFGISTAMIFAIVQRLIQTRFRDSGD
ncbi:MAG: ion channel [Candidatus Binataceae bacterium]